MIGRISTRAPLMRLLPFIWAFSFKTLLGLLARWVRTSHEVTRLHTDRVDAITGPESRAARHLLMRHNIYNFTMISFIESAEGENTTTRSTGIQRVSH